MTHISVKHAPLSRATLGYTSARVYISAQGSDITIDFPMNMRTSMTFRCTVTASALLVGARTFQQAHACPGSSTYIDIPSHSHSEGLQLAHLQTTAGVVFEGSVWLDA